MLSNSKLFICALENSKKILASSLRFKNNFRVKTIGGSSSEKSTNKRLAIQNAAALQNRVKWEREMSRAEKLPDLPQNNSRVYMLDDFKSTPMALDDAVNILKLASQAEVFDCAENPIRVKLFLNMKTKSNAKFINPMEAHVSLPHKLESLPPLKIMMICKDRSETDSLRNCGAKFVGDEDLLEKVTTGVIHYSEYDIVLANSSLEKTIFKMKSIFKDKLPSIKSRQMTDNLLGAYNNFKDITLTSTEAVLGVPEENSLTIPIGHVNWPIQHLSDNLRAYIEQYEKIKSGRLVGDLFKRGEIFLRPIDLRLNIDLESFNNTAQSTE